MQTIQRRCADSHRPNLDVDALDKNSEFVLGDEADDEVDFDEVDKSADDSFPASDPPSFTPIVAIGPPHAE